MTTTQAGFAWGVGALPAVGLRYYYRCAWCLSVSATAERISGPCECAACGGPVESMGEVREARLVREELRCPCDARCTHALGPQCDCRCCGANHGSGLMVVVIRDLGPIPKLRPRDALAAARGAEYRRLVGACGELLDELPGAAGAYHLLRAEWARLRIRKAPDRLRLLGELLRKLRGVRDAGSSRSAAGAPGAVGG